MAGKRKGGMLDNTPVKASNVETDPDSWTCASCGNINFGSRAFCNMRKCGAPKDDGATKENWVCPGCGNDNYGTRLYSNMRRCQQIKPGTSLKELQAAEGGRGGKGGGMQTLRDAAEFVRGLQSQPNGASQENAPGAWTCPACGNRNFPGRTKCNARGCGKPSPESTMPHWGKGAYPLVPQLFTVPVSPHAAMKGGKGGKNSSPIGSWVCTACQNVNFPTRDKCNAKGCGQSRELVDGGPPGTSAAPEGSWVCSSCQNLNWPSRTHCNARNCGQPRS